MCNSIEVQILARTSSIEHFTRDTAIHINDGATSHAIATWTVYVVLQKYFDPGRRSSIEFHEMKAPLHASLRPFQKAPIERIRGATRRDRVACNTCHRRKFRSCVVHHVRHGYIYFLILHIRLYMFRH